jgi:AcrR family transcriptional regulator
MTPPRSQAARAQRLEPSWELPRGRHRLPREVRAQHQRDRLIAGVATAIAEHGYGNVTVEHVIGAAGVSRSTFYENFENKDEAVLVAHEAIFERFLGIVFRACNAAPEWPSKVKSVICAALDYAASEPAQAGLLTLDALSANVEMTQQVLASTEHLAALLSRGRAMSKEGGDLPELTEKSVIGALTAIVSSRIANGEAEQLPELAPQLVELALTPYVGAAEAKRVAGSAGPGA